MLEPVRALLDALLLAFLILMVIRFVAEWVLVLRRDYRPSGGVAVVLEFVYSVTDPPLRALRRVLPPLRIGNTAFDLGFLVLFLVVSALRRAI
ncbi:MAG: YggT family protein [Frankia sp.]|nr:YggT family protein [Frankia sp.]